eukprot:4764763-Prorocentrum_lima.AAC.1
MDAPVSPHRPVVVKVAGPAKCLARVYPVPRAFPVVVPQGCHRDGFGQVWEKAKSEVVDACACKQLTTAWTQFLDDAKNVWLDVFQIPPDEAAAS